MKCEKCERTLTLQKVCLNFQCEDFMVTRLPYAQTEDGRPSFQPKSGPALSPQVFDKVLNFLTVKEQRIFSQAQTATKKLIEPALVRALRKAKRSVNSNGAVLINNTWSRPDDNEGPTYLHVAMEAAMDYALTHLGQGPFAILYKNNFAEDTLAIAGDASDEIPGHSPLVNLIHHLVTNDVGGNLFKDCLVFMNYPPTDADLGTFHLRVTGQSPFLIYIQPLQNTDGDLLVVQRPTRVDNFKRLTVHHLPARVEEKPVSYALMNKVDIFAAEVLAGQENETKKQQKKKKPPKKPTPYKKPVPAQHEWVELGLTRQSAQPLAYPALGTEGQQLFDTIAMLATYALASPLIKPGKDQHTVGSLLFSSQGDVLSWGVDFSAVIHAEVSTIKLLATRGESILKQKGCRLYTSLEPCIMCSGLLSDYGRDLELTVLFGQWDPAVHKMFIGNKAESTDDTMLKHHPSVEELVFDGPYASTGKKFATVLDATHKKMGERSQAIRVKIKELEGALDSKEDELQKLKKLATEGEDRSKSVTKSVQQEASFNRRFIKAYLQLIRLAKSLQEGTSPREAVRTGLLDMAKQCIVLVARINQTTPAEAVEKALELLEKSRDKNELRRAVEPLYSTGTHRKNTAAFSAQTGELLSALQSLGLA